MYHYEGLGFSIKRFNPVAATKAAISNVVKPVLKAAPKILLKPQTALTLTKEKILKPVIKSAVTLTKKTVINPTIAMMTTASPKALLTAGRQGGISAVLGTAVSSLQQPKAVGQQAETSIMDGPLVTIYAANGSEGQIPSNYLTNGTYTDETGMVWSAKAPVLAGSVSDANSFTNTFARRPRQGAGRFRGQAQAVVNRPSIMATVSSSSVADSNSAITPVSANMDSGSAGSMVPMNATIGTGGPIAAEQKVQAVRMAFRQRLAMLMRRPGA